MADVRRIDRAYGDLDNLPPGHSIATIRETLIYSKADQRAERSNPAKFPIDGSLYDSLASYRAALSFYQRFLDAGEVARGGSTFGPLDAYRPVG